MATAKSVEKSKTKKNVQARTPKQPRATKSKKMIDAQPAATKPDLVPISPEFEEKLTKSYYSMEKQLKVIFFTGPLASLYLLYLVVKSKGELVMTLNFLGVVVLSLGLGYSSRLFTKQSEKSVVVYGCTMGLITLFLGFIIWQTGSNRLLLGLFLQVFFALSTLFEMSRLKKYNFLY
jgi:hypothetical protein